MIRLLAKNVNGSKVKRKNLEVHMTNPSSPRQNHCKGQYSQSSYWYKKLSHFCPSSEQCLWVWTSVTGNGEKLPFFNGCDGNISENIPVECTLKPTLLAYISVQINQFQPIWGVSIDDEAVINDWTGVGWEWSPEAACRWAASFLQHPTQFDKVSHCWWNSRNL